MIRLTQFVHDAVIAHAVRSVPSEACGLLGGPEGTEILSMFVPVPNANESAMTFSLEPQAMLDAEAKITAEGLTVAGVMHSHTHTSPYPSPTDIADAARFDPLATHLLAIVSLAHAEPSLRIFGLWNGHVREETVTVTATTGLGTGGPTGPTA